MKKEKSFSCFIEEERRSVFYFSENFTIKKEFSTMLECCKMCVDE